VRGRLRTGIVATAALTAAVALYVLLTLPAPPLRLDAAWPDTNVIGAIHVHSVRSDGTGSVEEIARAAKRAGLSFVILTDHGDGTRPFDPPRYIDDVLVVDAVELNSREGHIVALGLSAQAPYPLAGAARDVIEDLHRLGAVAIAAHPDSPKESLRWRSTNMPFDGIEWINADSEWRDETPSRLIGGALRAVLRPSESIADLFSRPVASFRRWDQAARTRPVFGIAALDAHARIGWREDEEPRQRTALARPTYESMFRTLANVVQLDRALELDAVRDAERVIAALRSGRSYGVVRAQAEPAVLSFGAHAGGQRFVPGDRAESAGVVLTFAASVAGAPGARVTLFRNGQRIESGQGSVTAARAEPGVYRVEVNLPGREMPWIVSNPITIPGGPAVAQFGGRGGGAGGDGRGNGVQVGASTVPAETRVIDPSTSVWATEKDPLSTASTTVVEGRRVLSFTLGAGPAYGQYAALVAGGHDNSGVEEVSFDARATRPMRVSVQVRLPGGRDGERWQRSVYVDETSRALTLRLQDFERVGPPTTLRPNVAPVQALLFVVDTVNTPPGTSGELSLSGITLRVNRLGAN
jgi:hypothetical protein